MFDGGDGGLGPFCLVRYMDILHETKSKIRFKDVVSHIILCFPTIMCFDLLVLI